MNAETRENLIQLLRTLANSAESVSYILNKEKETRDLREMSDVIISIREVRQYVRAIQVEK